MTKGRNTVVIRIRVPDGLKARCEYFAKARKMNLSEWIREKLIRETGWEEPKEPIELPDELVRRRFFVE